MPTKCDLVIPVHRSEIEDFKRLQVQQRWDWPATFSVSPTGTIWPFCGYGHTPRIVRSDVRTFSPLLDEIADLFLENREGGGVGGRFFIDGQGVFYKNALSITVKFATFEFKD